MSKQTYLAVDIGASSGRVIAGQFDGARLSLAEVYRFENAAVSVGGHKLWNLLGQWQEVQTGLSASAERYGAQVVSVGVDTWGVDFGLLGKNDELLGSPYHYRDSRTDGMMARAFETVSREEIFGETGLQFLPFNTLFQLLAMAQNASSAFEASRALLMMPDLFHWLMTGAVANEMTNASTTQLYNPVTRQWSSRLIEKFGFPPSLFGRLVSPGTRLGRLRSDVAAECNLASAEVVLPGTHDTASAVMGVPADASERSDWCYISSGTWSLMGIEVARPVITSPCAELNFTNEGGVGETVRLLKNIAGLWLLQECRRNWQQEGHDYSWEELNRLANRAPVLDSFVEPDDERFLAPQDMAVEIGAACRQSGQKVPTAPGEIVRCILQSLALKYRRVLEWLEELNGSRIGKIHIVGGGTQNRILCQMTADACQRPVAAGPVEATSIGNVMVQAWSAGDVGSMAEARAVIRSSFEIRHYEPGPAEPWDEAYQKFLSLG